jgi:hypothetical protein
MPYICKSVILSFKNNNENISIKRGAREDNGLTILTSICLIALLVNKNAILVSQELKYINNKIVIDNLSKFRYGKKTNDKKNIEIAMTAENLKACSFFSIFFLRIVSAA